MDLDTTIKGLSLNIDTITKVINEIISININDNILLEIENIKKIREEEEYNGFNVNLKANFDGLKANLMIDITTGDIITYKEIEYKYQTLFDEEPISIMTYNYETIIAEKFEAIISRNIDNTRMKDYYDLFMLIKLKRKEINPETLRKAITNTAQNRNTLNYIKDAKKYIDLISNDEHIKKLWENYQNNYNYANSISFEDTISSIKDINKIISNIEFS